MIVAWSRLRVWNKCYSCKLNNVSGLLSNFEIEIGLEVSKFVFSSRVHFGLLQMMYFYFIMWNHTSSPSWNLWSTLCFSCLSLHFLWLFSSYYWTCWCIISIFSMNFRALSISLCPSIVTSFSKMKSNGYFGKYPKQASKGEVFVKMCLARL